MHELKEYQGQIRLGSLPWEIAERLAQFRGNWLEFMPEANAISFRHVQPVGCPALTGIPCELITLIDSIPPEFRESMPGGELSLKDERNRKLRLQVKQGELRIKWQQEPCFRTVAVSVENAAGVGVSSRAKVNGWARFAGTSSRSGELRDFVERFGGLYPEEDMPSECEQNIVYVRFRNASVEPGELVSKLRELADPLESLQAELEFESPGEDSADGCFRIQIADGGTEVTRPALAK